MGGKYTGLDYLTLFGSINDLGLMRWSSELNNLEVQQSFSYSGFTEDDLDTPDYVGLMMDSLRNSYSMNLTQETYYAILPLKTYVGATFDINSRIQAGILQRNLLYKWRLFPSLTISANMELTDYLSLTASYSYNKYSFSNFGAGLTLGSNNVQFYMATDNLAAIKPTSVRNVNLKFGFNLFFGCGDESENRGISPPSSGEGCFWIKRRQENERILPDK